MKITCHDSQTIMGYEAVWRAPVLDSTSVYSKEYRTCSWCGSLHPEDLLKILEAGGHLDVADWKYGWPHKFYVNYPNLNAGNEVVIGRNDDGPMMGRAPAQNMSKWYNTHLKDVEGELFDKLCAAIHKQTGVRFERDELGIKWSAEIPSM